MCFPERAPDYKRLDFGIVVQTIVATFLSQTLTKELLHFNSSRSLMAAWLIFALVVGTVYRGNLTAALTLPKYPPRTETVQQLVDTFSRYPRSLFHSKGSLWQNENSNKGRQHVRHQNIYQNLIPCYVTIRTADFSPTN